MKVVQEISLPAYQAYIDAYGFLILSTMSTGYGLLVKAVVNWACIHERYVIYHQQLDCGCGVEPEPPCFLVGRNSSVGRALDWRSKGPWFNPGFRHRRDLAVGKYFYDYCLQRTLSETLPPSLVGYWRPSQLVDSEWREDSDQPIVVNLPTPLVADYHVSLDPIWNWLSGWSPKTIFTWAHLQEDHIYTFGYSTSLKRILNRRTWKLTLPTQPPTHFLIFSFGNFFTYLKGECIQNYIFMRKCLKK